jgi:NitT/TauT family transport system permease protein
MPLSGQTAPSDGPSVVFPARFGPLRRISGVTGWRLKLIFFIGLLLLWEALVRLQLWPSYVFPSPLAVGRSLFAGIANGFIPLAVLTSLRRILLAYALSLLIGIPLGLLLGRTRLLQETLGTLVLGLQALPSICWLPLALLWFGLSEMAIGFVVVMGAVLSITVSTADGVRNTPPLYLRAARTMGARGWRLNRRFCPGTPPSFHEARVVGPGAADTGGCCQPWMGQRLSAASSTTWLASWP